MTVKQMAFLTFLMALEAAIGFAGALAWLRFTQ